MVAWYLPVTATDPMAAARLASDMQADPNGIYTCYTVEDVQTGTKTTVDLEGDGCILNVEEPEVMV